MFPPKTAPSPSGSSSHVTHGSSGQAHPNSILIGSAVFVHTKTAEPINIPNALLYNALYSIANLHAYIIYSRSNVTTLLLQVAFGVQIPSAIRQDK